MPPDDDPIIRSLRDAGIRPLHERGPRAPDGRSVKLLVGLVATVFLLFVLVPAAATRLSDWLWYREIGFERVWLTKVLAQWVLGIPTAIVAFGILWLNAWLALRGVEASRESIVTRVRRGELTTEDARDWLLQVARTLAVAGCVLLAILVALVAASNWRTVLQAMHATPFGITDPVFGRDVGYYVFRLPVVELATELLVALLWIALLFIALPIHLLRKSFVMRDWRRPWIAPEAQAQFAVLAGILLLVVAVRLQFVHLPGLLFGEHGALSGASWSDLHARRPALHVLSAIAFLGALAIAWAGTRGRLVPMAVRVVGIYVVAALLARAVPAGYQRLVVQPNELARETPQIVHHIRATRQAWGLGSVTERELGTDTELTPALIQANRATIDNVRLWDREPLLQTFGQIQSIRTYYDFVAVDDDRYRVKGELRQLMLAAREMDTRSLPTRGFINEHLTYTHGMGLTLGPSNEVTAEGLPLLFIKDLPPVSSIETKVTQPRIYYGELANDFVLAPSRQREFDYPAGEGDAAAYSRYDGRGGVPVGSLWRRALYALRFGSANILLSGDIGDSTRILYHRSVRERAERALPFLLFDRDPYLVIADDGRLHWILDAYTWTNRFPYAEPVAGGVNYMRNSVKVVIDAYHGSVDAYLADPGDPMVRTLARIYPGALQPMDSMPADLRAHLRYPEDLFRLQTALYGVYHMDDPETFYHREDQWQIPGAAGSSEPVGSPRRGEGEAFLRHMVMRLPGEADPEFILMRPFTPRQKDNLAAWMVARNDGEHYGKLVVYRFPRQSLVFGPNQIVNRINQDTEIARQISLWDQRGSEVLRGELLVIPIGGALIYVQPLYLRAQGGRIPELKRVIAAHEGRVAMAETLDSALRALFGAPTPGRPGAAPVLATVPGAPPAADTSAATPAAADLARRARDHYDRARAAQRADDWATYGAEMRRLGEVLRQLEGRP